MPLDELQKLDQAIDKLPTTAKQWEMLLDPLTQYGLQLLAAAAILVIGWWIANRTYHWSLLAMKKAKLDMTLGKFLASMLRYTILGFTLIAVLGKFGVQTASLIALLGAAGLAIGLALQGTLSHVASGVMLLIFRPFKVGDYIEVGSHGSGSVDEIGLFMTTIDTPQNVRITIPNSLLWSGAIRNFNAHNKRRLDVTLTLGYADNIALALKTLQDTLAKHPKTLPEPAPQATIDALGETTITIATRSWCKRADFGDYKADIHRAIVEKLAEAGISLPFAERRTHSKISPQAKK
ncbi:MAG: mechanosensitive ion channel family protein [Alphaproteobacteria bacterium]